MYLFLNNVFGVHNPFTPCSRVDGDVGADVGSKDGDELGDDVGVDVGARSLFALAAPWCRALRSDDINVY
jgi:hypothetical protein